MFNSHVLPKIGDIPIDRIQYSTLAGLLATLDCSAKTRNNIATVIRQPIVLALRDGRIKDNPAQHLANAKVQKESPDPFTLEEAEAILGYLKNKPVFHNYFELAFFNGMRTSKLIALTWQDIDFQRQCVRVNKASVAGKLKSTIKPTAIETSSSIAAPWKLYVGNGKEQDYQADTFSSIRKLAAHLRTTKCRGDRGSTP